MYVIPSEHIQQQLFWHGYYEKPAILSWEALIRPGDIVFDIGANTGYYSLVASRVAKKVYAFEPASGMRQQLEKNIALNKITTISVEPFALSQSTGRVKLYISSSENTGMSSLQPPENFSGQKETVNTISLDDWIIDHGPVIPSLIKIDAEGVEANILAGMRALLDQHRPIIFIEIRAELLSKFGHTPSSVYQFLESRNYSAFEPVKPRVLTDLHEQKEADTVIFLPEGYQLPSPIRLLKKVDQGSTE